MSSSDKTLEAALADINKQYGAGAVMKLGDNRALDIEAVSTGSIVIDRALGIGGLPRGRIAEIYGPESSGKTTLTLHLIAQAQKDGGKCAFIDAEHALDPVYAAAIGVNVDELYVSQPDAGEDALEITKKLVETGAFSVVVIDSVAALTPRAEIAGEMGDAHVGLQARLMSQAMRKLVPVVKQSNTALVFINQIREKVGVIYGSPETQPGGRALKFYASVRIDIRRRGAIKSGVEVIGNETDVKIVKNKVAPPFKVANVDILYGIGIDNAGTVRDLGVQMGWIEKGGAWYTIGDERIQGGPATSQYLRDNPEICDEIEAHVRAGEVNA